MGIHRTVVPVKIIPPNFVEKTFARERYPPILDKIKQQLIFFRSEFRPFAVDVNVASRDIDLQSFEFILIARRSFRRPLGAVDNGMDARNDLLGRKGLGDIVV